LVREFFSFAQAFNCCQRVLHSSYIGGVVSVKIGLGQGLDVPCVQVAEVGKLPITTVTCTATVRAPALREFQRFKNKDG
jgi:hypothetical protein